MVPPRARVLSGKVLRVYAFNPLAMTRSLGRQCSAAYQTFRAEITGPVIIVVLAHARFALNKIITVAFEWYERR